MTASMRVPTTIEFYAKVEHSPVYNLLGDVILDVQLEPIIDETREPGDAVDATMRIVDFDIVAALRAFADELERSREG